MWRMVVRGSAGQTQIDMNYKNHQTVQSGSLAASSFTNIAYSGVAYYNLVISGLTSPMLAVRTEGTAVYHVHTVAGGNHTFQIIKGTAGTAPVEWWLFDVAAPGQGALGGRNNMVIRNPANNEIVFDLGRKPLRIADFIQQDDSLTGDPGSGATTGRDYTYTAGRKYAVIPCRGGGFAQSVTLGVGTNLDRMDFTFDVACQGIPNGLRITMLNTYNRIVPASNSPPWTTGYNSRFSDWLVADVTNY